MIVDEKYQSDINTIAERYRNNQADRDTVMLKLAEECSELSAELIQKALHPTHTPDESEVLDELGDVLVRASIFYAQLNDKAKKHVISRMEHKITKAIKRL